MGTNSKKALQVPRSQGGTKKEERNTAYLREQTEEGRHHGFREGPSFSAYIWEHIIASPQVTQKDGESQWFCRWVAPLGAHLIRGQMPTYLLLCLTITFA